MTRFRPCIDLHNGLVKQIVGGTLSEQEEELRTNFVAEQSAEWFASRYARDGLTGGHVIKLGPGNDQAAAEALAAYPGGLQLGGGITMENAAFWLGKGASQVIVTSWLFDGDGRFLWDNLRALSREIGSDRLVVDLSCRKSLVGWTVAMNRWQTMTNLNVTPAVLDDLSEYCSEFLIHAADVEGLCRGIDRELVALLGAWQGRPMTYAGGIYRMEDLHQIHELSEGTLDATVGSALDLFGGTGVAYEDLLRFNTRTGS